MVWRVTAVNPETATIRANLRHRSATMSSLRMNSIPASMQADPNADSRGLARPSSSPARMRVKVPVWRITPGPPITADTSATPARAWASPSTRDSTGWASIPFCSDSTPVSGPISGLQAAAAVSVSQSFTPNSTMSTGPIEAGSSVAETSA